MKSRTLLLACLGLLLVLPACGGSSSTPRKKKTPTTVGPGVTEGPVQERTFAPPGSNETQYILYLRTAQDKASSVLGDRDPFIEQFEKGGVVYHRARFAGPRCLRRRLL